ncbi:g4710 [Coccomyxa elongata]
MESSYLRDLTLSNWTHWIDIGFYQQSNAIRKYGWEHHWVIDGKGPMQRYSMLWDNLAYGDATQLVGGYTAGYLVLSCASALAYLGLWLRCVIVIKRQRQDVGDLESPPKGPPHGTPRGTPPSNKRLIRPLGPWLWPAALTHTVLLAVLVITFYLLMDATTAYQSRRVAPGVECHVAPAWAWWCAMSAVPAWLTVTIMASVEAARQGRVKTTAQEAAAHGRQTSVLPPLRPPLRPMSRGHTSAASSA